MDTPVPSLPASVRRSVEKEIIESLPALRAFARSLTRDSASAEDLVQDAVERALRGWASFEAGSSMKAWLFGILRNRFIDTKRRLYSKLNVPFEPQHDRPQEEDAELEFEKSHDIEVDLRKALRYFVCIPMEMANALVAVEYLGLSYEAAAERLECPLGTIRSRLSRAKSTLISLMRTDAAPSLSGWEDMRNATKGIPRSHPYFPIAEAYERLYLLASAKQETDAMKERHGVESSEEKDLWRNLVAAINEGEHEENMSDLMRNDLEL